MRAYHGSLAVLGVTLVLSACDRTDSAPETNAESEAEVYSLSDASVPLYSETACTGAPSARPSPGAVFDYALLNEGGPVDETSLRRQTIGAVTGDQVDYSESLIMARFGEMPAEPRQARLGMLPTRFMDNSLRYEDTSAVGRLRPGQSATLAVTETRNGGEPKSGQAVVTFVGCGVAEPVIAGAAGERVRVFRVRVPYSSAEAGADFDRSIESEHLISESRGWPVAERQRGGVFVLSSAR